MILGGDRVIDSCVLSPVVFRPGPDESHGVYEAPLAALWRLFAGLDVFPVELVEVAA